MQRNDTLILINETFKQDSIGQQIAQTTEKEICCNISSVSQSEFFSASQQGLKPQYKVTVFCYDYDDEKIAQLHGKRFAIYRTFLKDNEDIELYLEEQAGISDEG